MYINYLRSRFLYRTRIHSDLDIVDDDDDNGRGGPVIPANRRVPEFAEMQHQRCSNIVDVASRPPPSLPPSLFLAARMGGRGCMRRRSWLGGYLPSTLTSLTSSLVLSSTGGERMAEDGRHPEADGGRRTKAQRIMTVPCMPTTSDNGRTTTICGDGRTRNNDDWKCVRWVDEEGGWMWKHERGEERGRGGILGAQGRGEEQADERGHGELRGAHGRARTRTSEDTDERGHGRARRERATDERGARTSEERVNE
ncbi:hypothetical protein BDN70DRAFT_901741 [Pholiota conissans]|uniref:Uncharacterized protein n=1 Tax=Pholiota conissans TaxID=109636 RepID=A0A9P6CSC6_9AGAR|nr:hypothetical protein BDN70DRAFT_901741 [Pholiota conissans]